MDIDGSTKVELKKILYVEAMVLASATGIICLPLDETRTTKLGFHTKKELQSQKVDALGAGEHFAKVDTAA